MKNKTRKTYHRIIRQIAKHAGKPAGQLTFADFAAFVDDRAMADYAPQSLNLYRAAANKYLAANGSDERLPMVKAKSRLPHVCLRDEVAALLAALNPFYRAIAERIYTTPAPPVAVLADTPSPHGGTVTARTFAKQLRNTGIGCTPYALFVSGVIHALEDGRDWREVGAVAGLADSTMAKYIKQKAP